jgi:hypothetical protein
MGLKSGSILNRFCHTFKKRGHIPMAVFIFEYLGTVFGHHFEYVDIKHLAGLVAYIAKSTGRKRAPINLDRFNSCSHLTQTGAPLPLPHQPARLAFCV